MIDSIDFHRNELLFGVFGDGFGAAFLQKIIVVEDDADVVEHLVKLARRRLSYQRRSDTNLFQIVDISHCWKESEK